MSSDTTDTEAVTFVITTKDGRPLTTEELTSLDRGVRESRRRGFCGTFDEVAAITFNIPSEHVLDSDGRTCAGYDHEGYSENGFNRDGFDKNGFNRDGFDSNGYDKNGFNRFGFNANGFNADGQDEYSFDSQGYDREGYDRTYGERRCDTRAWYATQAAKPDSEFRFNRRGRVRPTT